jgi:hypothetical protein
MRNTVTLMLDQLSAREINDLIALSSQFRKRFASVAAQVLEVAREKGIEVRVARLSIATETLLLSATMYSGTRDSFAQAALRAMDDAEKKAPKEPRLIPGQDF